MKYKVAIQGILGSNHHQVAINCFEDPELVPCLSFDALVAAVIGGEADIAVMAIENSIAGSIIPNYNLICQNGLHIVGEYYLNIHHHLMVRPGQQLSDILEVRSHPMALLQCKDFLQKYPHIKLVEDVDTAAPARDIQQQQLSGIGAIAPEVSALLYDLDIIASDIQTIKNNATRFIIIKKENHFVSKDEINKASLQFVTDHKRGSLATVLNVMSDCNLNLTKIQSLPIIDKPWKYTFFVDVTFEDYDQFGKAKSLLTIMVEDFRVLGEYKNALLV